MAHQLLHVHHQLVHNLLLPLIHRVEGEILQISLYLLCIHLCEYFLDVVLHLLHSCLVMIGHSQHLIVELLLRLTHTNRVEHILSQLSELL